jgi:hypothetical protein
MKMAHKATALQVNHLWDLNFQPVLILTRKLRLPNATLWIIKGGPTDATSVNKGANITKAIKLLHH